MRNIYLKKLSKVWDSSLQKYAVNSILSTFFLLPVVLVKVFINQKIATIRISEDCYRKDLRSLLP